MFFFREWELGLFSSFCFTIACERAYTIFIKQKQNQTTKKLSNKQKHTTKCAFKRMEGKIRPDSNDGCLNPYLKMQCCGSPGGKVSLIWGLGWLIPFLWPYLKPLPTLPSKADSFYQVLRPRIKFISTSLILGRGIFICSSTNTLSVLSTWFSVMTEIIFIKRLHVLVSFQSTSEMSIFKNQL